jgi:2-polyprenyl-3-methyl-5-hydroxy-6-metoxy-1,4-benzoquinol methylase
MNKLSNKIFKDSHERLIPKESPLLNKKMINDHFSRYKFVIPYVKNKTVLDIACGVGYGSQMFAVYGAKRVVGVDISKKAIAYAKDEYSHKNVDFIIADATKIPFKNGIFDIVVSFETLEHLKNPIDFVREITRVLKKRGLLILSSPNGLFKQVFDNPYHYHEYDLKELKELLGTNFTDLELYGQQNLPVLYMGLIGKLLRSTKSSKLRWFLRSGLLYLFRSHDVRKIIDNEKVKPSIYVIKADKF